MAAAELGLSALLSCSPGTSSSHFSKDTILKRQHPRTASGEEIPILLRAPPKIAALQEVHPQRNLQHQTPSEGRLQVHPASPVLTITAAAYIFAEAYLWNLRVCLHSAGVLTTTPKKQHQAQHTCQLSPACDPHGGDQGTTILHSAGNASRAPRIVAELTV